MNTGCLLDALQEASQIELERKRSPRLLRAAREATADVGRGRATLSRRTDISTEGFRKGPEEPAGLGQRPTDRPTTRHGD